MKHKKILIDFTLRSLEIDGGIVINTRKILQVSGELTPEIRTLVIQELQRLGGKK